MSHNFWKDVMLLGIDPLESFSIVFIYQSRGWGGREIVSEKLVLFLFFEFYFKSNSFKPAIRNIERPRWETQN